jgi:hypothetical protein
MTLLPVPHVHMTDRNVDHMEPCPVYYHQVRFKGTGGVPMEATSITWYCGLVASFLDIKSRITLCLLFLSVLVYMH